MSRRMLAVVATAVLAAAAVTPTAQAAPKPKKKPITESFTFTDNTPDVTYDITAPVDRHCDGKLPKEQPQSISLPAAGKLRVKLAEFYGDWALQILDSKNVVRGGDDKNPPEEFEDATLTIKSKGTYKILPCNLGGTTTAKVTWTFTYKQ